VYVVVIDVTVLLLKVVDQRVEVVISIGMVIAAIVMEEDLLVVAAAAVVVLVAAAVVRQGRS
jgi:hypothetical protein